MSGAGSVREPDANRPGSVLRAEREALGVSVREVAETLNLSIAVIEAIESDDLDRLPGTVFARGYVRAYARLLELEPGPLVAQYPRATDPAPAPPVATEAPLWEWLRRRPGVVLSAATALLVLLLVVLAMVVWPDGTDAPGGSADAVRDQAPVEDPERAAPVDAGPRVDSPTDWIEVPSEADAEAAATERSRRASIAASDAAAGGASDAITGSVGDVVAAEPVLELGAMAPGSSVRRLTPLGEDRLSFGFSDDCWVEIKSGSGANLYSDLNRAGTALDLVGEGPFRILLGYAPGAQITFNGEPVPLAPHTRNNVATLVLGQ